MKKNFYYLSLLLGLVFGLSMFTACGSDDDDDGNGDGTYNSTNIQGIWTGETADKKFQLIFVFYPNNTTESYLYELQGQNYVSKSSGEGTYVFDTKTGVVTVTYSDDNTTESFQIADQKYSSFTLYIGDTPFYMTRYKDSGGGNSGGGGSSGGGSSYDDDDDDSSDQSRVVQTRALKITHHVDTFYDIDSYSDETVTVYYKINSDGSVDNRLFRDSACGSMIGYFSDNDDSKCGDYSVGSFDYCYWTTNGLHSTIYYYFD